MTLPAAVAFVLLIVVGMLARVCSPEPFKGTGFDEEVYQGYVDQISRDGWTSYPALTHRFLEAQRKIAGGLPTPTRVAVVLAGSAWHRLWGTSPLGSVHAVSCVASILSLLIATAFAYRLKNIAFSLATLALLTFSPTQLYLAHRALADSFMCLVVLVALWSLWEILAKSPRLWTWRAVYGVSLVLMVLTKENAAFPYLGILGLVIVARWFKFGLVDRPLVLVTLMAPLAGVLLLGLCAGGWNALVDVYSLDVSKSLGTDYAIATEDGPWFRYILDHLMVNPVVILLAIGGALCLTSDEKAGLYLLVFIVVSYVPMCNVPHGINLRYAMIWDMPLTFLSLLPLFRWAQAFTGDFTRKLFLVAIVSAVALGEIHNYIAIFVDHAIYDPVTGYLMQALKMIGVQAE